LPLGWPAEEIEIKINRHDLDIASDEGPFICYPAVGITAYGLLMLFMLIVGAIEVLSSVVR
jgi:hypothetical protein